MKIVLKQAYDEDLDIFFIRWKGRHVKSIHKISEKYDIEGLEEKEIKKLVMKDYRAEAVKFVEGLDAYKLLNTGSVHEMRQVASKVLHFGRWS